MTGTPPTARPGRTRTAAGRAGEAVGVVVGVIVLLAAGAALALRSVRGPHAGDTGPAVPAPAPPPSCVVTTSAGRLHLDPSQAANAATIAAVAKGMGLGGDAVTVAYVASLQESKLRNLTYGDLDSLGLFQQRPSEGWGTSLQLVNPSYAARAFFDALVHVPGWQALPVGDAAQQVQRSAGPDAYHAWEPQARTLTEAFTGQAGGELTCRFDAPSAVPAAMPLDQAAAAELGAPLLDVPVPPAQGWTVASWLVAHAYDYGVSSVTYLGQRWTPASGAWQAAGPVEPEVRVERS